ncbi:MAG: hypothetical protein ABEJ03_06005, partial [Candidatus Nanohaloarchaea archaeon]
MAYEASCLLNDLQGNVRTSVSQIGLRKAISLFLISSAIISVSTGAPSGDEGEYMYYGMEIEESSQEDKDYRQNYGYHHWFLSDKAKKDKMKPSDKNKRIMVKDYSTDGYFNFWDLLNLNDDQIQYFEPEKGERLSPEAQYGHIDNNYFQAQLNHIFKDSTKKCINDEICPAVNRELDETNFANEPENPNFVGQGKMIESMGVQIGEADQNGRRLLNLDRGIIYAKDTDSEDNPDGDFKFFMCGNGYDKETVIDDSGQKYRCDAKGRTQKTIDNNEEWRWENDFQDDKQDGDDHVVNDWEKVDDCEDGLDNDGD